MRIATIVLQLTAMCATGILPVMAQTPVGPVTADSGGRVEDPPSDKPTPAKPEPSKGPERAPNYILGPDDQIIIRAFRAEELSEKPIQIPGDGYINLPMVGKVKAGGLSVSAFEAALTEKLKQYLNDPQVTVFVADYRSEPVSVVGSVANPGVVQLKGQKTLVEVIALAGGLKADAGNSATITRELSMGKLPLPGATNDADGRFSIAKVNLRSVMEARNPQDNILVKTNDVITIPKAQLLYVVGEVQKPGGYPLNEKDSMSVLQAVALAGGLTPKASAKKAKILYQDKDHPQRTEVATDVRKILAGRAPDIQLSGDDILFVPSSLPKSAGTAAMQAALNMAGVAVWKF